MDIKKKALIVFAAALICFSASGILSAQTEKYKALLGTWDVETESGEYTFVFVFSMEGETLKGTFTGQSGETAMKNLSFENNNLKFTVDVGVVIDFSATVKEGKLEGMLSLEYGDSNIVGKKRT